MPERAAYESAVALLREHLLPDGWEIVATAYDSSFGASLKHDLTTEMTLSAFGTQDPVVFVRRFLASREIEVIARAPSVMPHRALVGAVRSASAGGCWNPGVVDQVASLLLSFSLLTEAEASWLEEAGVPWDLQADSPASSSGVIR